MDKRVTLKLNNGDLQTGFSTTLQIGNEGEPATVELSATLPAAPQLQSLYQQWQSAYRNLGTPSRLGSRAGAVTNVSLVGDCQSLSQQLVMAFNQWLGSEAFRPVRSKLLERLNPTDTVRFIVQTAAESVQRLPWHQWELCDRYPNLEIALAAPAYEQANGAIAPTRSAIRILAILGHSAGLDIDTDKALLNHLPNAEVQFLVEPNRQTLDTHLWDPQGWDILFFAGHSNTQCEPANAQTSVGQLYLNNTDSITIQNLKNALRKAVSRGLKIAIFNSCDGLGLAQALADLHISQVLVMREPIPDQVAHTFLKSFLEAFSRDESFYLAVREAREKLQALEDKFLCASWLPTIYQNLATVPPTWKSLFSSASGAAMAESVGAGLGQTDGGGRQEGRGEAPEGVRPYAPTRGKALWMMLGTHVFLAVGLVLLRTFGLFQPLELKAFDALTKARPAELSDSRFLVVTVTPEDIQAQTDEERRGSLADTTLLKLLNILEPLKPAAIGLDIYRDFPVKSNLPELAQKLENSENIIALCKGRDIESNSNGIAAPPEVPTERVGFSDFTTDPDGIIRRQLIYMEPEASSPCGASYSLNALLALNYLNSQGIVIGTSPEDYLQAGDVTFTPIEKDAGSYASVDNRGHHILLNYRSLDKPEQIADSITLTELLEGNIDPGVVLDKIVLIGTVDNSYPDAWQTPYSQSPNPQHQTPGVFMQAQMTSQLISAVLNDRPLIRTWNPLYENIWIILWGGVGSLIMIGLRQRKSTGPLILALLVTEIGLAAICWLLLAQSHYWVPWVPAAIAPVLIVSSRPLTNRLSTATRSTNADRN